MPSLKTEFAHHVVSIFAGKLRLKDGLVWLFGGSHGRGLLDIGRQKMAKGKTPKPKTCPICSTEYIPRSSLQKVCHNYKCAIAFNKQRDAEIAAREQRKRDKEARAKWRERKAEVKPLKHWEDLTQRGGDDYIREQDRNLP